MLNAKYKNIFISLCSIEEISDYESAVMCSIIYKSVIEFEKFINFNNKD